VDGWERVWGPKWIVRWMGGSMVDGWVDGQT